MKNILLFLFINIYMFQIEITQAIVNNSDKSSTSIKWSRETLIEKRKIDKLQENFSSKKIQ